MSRVLRVTHLKKLRVKPAAVNAQLLHGARPERVASGNQHGVLAFFDVAADLMDELRSENEARGIQETQLVEREGTELTPSPASCFCPRH
jgi:hypothetical protein